MGGRHRCPPRSDGGDGPGRVGAGRAGLRRPLCPARRPFGRETRCALACPPRDASGRARAGGFGRLPVVRTETVGTEIVGAELAVSGRGGGGTETATAGTLPAGVATEGATVEWKVPASESPRWQRERSRPATVTAPARGPQPRPPARGGNDVGKLAERVRAGVGSLRAGRDDQRQREKRHRERSTQPPKLCEQMISHDQLLIINVTSYPRSDPRKAGYHTLSLWLPAWYQAQEGHGDIGGKAHLRRATPSRKSPGGSGFSDAAREDLVRSHLPLVRAVARRQAGAVSNSTTPSRPVRSPW